MIIKSNLAKILYPVAEKAFSDAYDGNERIKCDEECEPDCDEDHGFYELPKEFNPLFNG
jgi:hypothetical protein